MHALAVQLLLCWLLAETANPPKTPPTAKPTTPTPVTTVAAMRCVVHQLGGGGGVVPMTTVSRRSFSAGAQDQLLLERRLPRRLEPERVLARVERQRLACGRAREPRPIHGNHHPRDVVARPVLDHERERGQRRPHVGDPERALRLDLGRTGRVGAERERPERLPQLARLAERERLLARRDAQGVVRVSKAPGADRRGHHRDRRDEGPNPRGHSCLKRLLPSASK